MYNDLLYYFKSLYVIVLVSYFRVLRKIRVYTSEDVRDGGRKKEPFISRIEKKDALTRAIFSENSLKSQSNLRGDRNGESRKYPRENEC